MNLFEAAEGALIGWAEINDPISQAITDTLWELYYNSLPHFKAGGKQLTNQTALAWRRTTIVIYNRPSVDEERKS